MMQPRCWGLMFACSTLCVAAINEPAQTNPIERLMTKPLAYEPKHGYLEAVLKELNIDPSSQVLVFSKTSLQTDFITKKTPRSFYFNSDTYVGWIPDAPFIEIATLDARRGVMFYTISNSPSKSPAFDIEPKDCNRCHGRRSSYRPSDLFVNSVYTSPAGYSRPFAPAPRVTPELPLRRRWGGWYVTGTHGDQRHMGNETSEGDDYNYSLDMEKGANVTSLSRYFNTARYLTPSSDIVALMTLEHQLQVQNEIARLTIQPDEDVESLVRALLCVGETKLTAPIQGSNDFAKKYRDQFPKDHLGRSLGEFDLKTRLLKYPCSPLIYSESFNSLPQPVRKAVFHRISDVLTGKGSSGEYSHLSETDRKNIDEILKDTAGEIGYGASRVADG